MRYAIEKRRGRHQHQIPIAGEYHGTMTEEQLQFPGVTPTGIHGQQASHFLLNVQRLGYRCLSNSLLITGRREIGL